MQRPDEPGDVCRRQIRVISHRRLLLIQVRDAPQPFRFTRRPSVIAVITSQVRHFSFVLRVEHTTRSWRVLRPASA